MKKLEERFKAAIQQAAAQKNKFTLSIGVVSNVEDDVCDVGPYKNVRLRSITGDLESQLTIYPKEGSQAIVGRIDGEDRAVLIATSEVDKITAKIGDRTFLMTKDGFEFDGDAFGGMVKSPVLENQLSTMSARIDKIINALTTAPTGSSDGGATYKSGISGMISSLQKEDFSNLQNKKIKHG